MDTGAMKYEERLGFLGNSRDQVLHNDKETNFAQVGTRLGNNTMRIRTPRDHIRYK